MVKHNQDGAVSILVLVLVIVLLIAAIAFGGWAFSSRQDYKDNTDAKINDAVTIAKQQQTSIDNKQFAEASKKPLKTYGGPEAYGSIVLNYPKTWSGYVDDTGTGSALVDGYFSPGVVPSISAQTSIFALRVQVLSQSYAQSLQSLTSSEQGGKVTVNAYALPKLSKVVGVEANGQINGTSTETMVMLPLRSQTIEIYTQGTQYLNDFNNYILPNFSFSP